MTCVKQTGWQRRKELQETRVPRLCPDASWAGVEPDDWSRTVVPWVRRIRLASDFENEANRFRSPTVGLSSSDSRDLLKLLASSTSMRYAAP